MSPCRDPTNSKAKARIFGFVIPPRSRASSLSSRLFVIVIEVLFLSSLIVSSPIVPTPGNRTADEDPSGQETPQCGPP